MRELSTPRKWVQIKPSRRHADDRVGPNQTVTVVPNQTVIAT
ncbi:hypothetical protein DFJ65_1050 [Calidifontibacter indicus]|uniref:Uncharacterized protein n=2 Tax=Actinomycetes TaxID=1760 RepID=A0A3D9ULA7_9MICO|nr:hypothetical protein DFJ65_1050 [Calidifontibacter indicus]